MLAKTFLKPNDGDIIIIRFTAPWCAPCQVLKTIIKNNREIQDFLKSIKAYLVYDIDSETELLIEGVEIPEPSSIPVLSKLVYHNMGWNEVSRLVGLKTEEELLNWFKPK